MNVAQGNLANQCGGGYFFNSRSIAAYYGTGVAFGCNYGTPPFLLRSPDSPLLCHLGKDVIPLQNDVLIGEQAMDRPATVISCGAISALSTACVASRMDNRQVLGGLAMRIGRRATDVPLLGVASARMHNL